MNAPPTPPTTQASNAGFFWGKLSQEGKERVLKNVGVKAAKRFKTKFEGYKAATGLRQPTEVQQLAMFRGRPIQAWAAIRQAMPREYAKQMKAWQTLETKSVQKLANPLQRP